MSNRCLQHGGEPIGVAAIGFVRRDLAASGAARGQHHVNQQRQSRKALYLLHLF